MKLAHLLLLGLTFVSCIHPLCAQQPCNCPKDKWCEHKPVWLPKALYNTNSYSITFPKNVKLEWYMAAKKPWIKRRQIETKKAEPLFGLELESCHKYLFSSLLTDDGIDIYDNELRNKLFIIFHALDQLPAHHWNGEYSCFSSFRSFLKDLALKNPILLYLYDVKEEKNAGQTNPPDCFNVSHHNPKGNDSWIKLGVYAKAKDRTTFSKNPNIKNPKLESMKTTMAHEMGHVFIMHSWEHLRELEHKSNNGKTIDLWPSRVAHEAYAVYTEYLYLKELAKWNYINSFNIVDFIKDAATKQQGSPSLFSVNPEYMLCFLKGLDYENMTFDAKGNITDIAFNYNFLKRTSDICHNLKIGKILTDKDYQYKLIFKPALYENKIVLGNESNLFVMGDNLSEEAKEQLCQVKEAGVISGKKLRDEESIIIDYRLAVDQFEDESELYMANLPPMGVNFPQHCEPWASMKLDRVKDTEAIKNEKMKKMAEARKQIIQDILNHLINYNLNQCKQDLNYTL